ncbi:hypothetical protein P5673_029522 [Acropora cervicornis]|uniref:Uncharacterized protein n=1 Tax=Acropora cervicornis TaxID=6130 RepID=A0AAD9UUB6_ACRCE|nr:hypothetical protein P5673_029522 [Acropora cervicornis]
MIKGFNRIQIKNHLRGQMECAVLERETSPKYATPNTTTRYTSTGFSKPFFCLSLMTLLLLTTVHFLLSTLHQNSVLLSLSMKSNPISKAAGPDGILNRVLREFSDELAYPVTELLNLSFEADIGKKIDLRQFGSIKGSSTSLCLVDLLRNWLKSLDNPVITFMHASLTLARPLIALITLLLCGTLQTLNLPSLLLRRESLCSKSFSKFTSLANSRFLPLLPPRRCDANDSATSLRNSSNFTLPAVRPERFKRSRAFSTLPGICPGGFIAGIWGTSPRGTAVSFGLGVSCLLFRLTAALLSVSMR